jgi:hypothetical protein
VPLLPADDPDADSGTFPLGRPAQGAIGTKGHIPAGGRDPGASGLSPHTGQPGASPDRRTADRAAAPDGSATSTGMPLPPAQPPGVRQTGATSAPRWAPGDAPGVAHSAATAAGRRSIGAVDLRPGPGAGRPFVFSARPESYDDSTTRLRPVRDRGRPRTLAAAACVVLGLGLIGGAATGSWLTGDSSAADPGKSFAAAADLWHNTPVDQLFPPVIHGDGAGPGGADRIWTRVAVAPDSGCDNAFDPLLYKALAPVGCLRLLRATYTDATLSQVTTVGLLFTKADPAAMGVLRSRFTRDGLDRRTDLMPRPYAAKDTDAAGFGDAQRASWTVSVLTDAPVVVYAVSGFADGRTVQDPQPAADAMETTATTAPAQAGLGFEAKGLADRVERGLRKTIGTDDADGTDGTRTEQP